MRIHYLQHVPFENPGSILGWAAKNCCTVTKTALYDDGALPPQEDFDWLIIMGGPMNVYQSDKYPWLTCEKAFIKAASDGGKVVIGLCLGAQLIADALGGRVTKNPCSEIGWLNVRMTDAARADPLFSFMPPEPTVFQWHGDTFSVLPDGAVLLVGGEACTNQAFRCGSRVFGFQFHLESTPETIGALIDNCRGELIPGRYVQSADEILSRADLIAEDNLFLEMFLDKLAQRQFHGPR